jgi:hypothetical protein
MKIVYLHYHLNPGGVTTVLRQQVVAMARDHEVLVLCGSLPPKDLEAPARQLPQLNYDSLQKAPVKHSALAEAIDGAIREHWPYDCDRNRGCDRYHGCDLIHVHNPTLVKNQALLPALGLLQKKGHRLLLQIHDFAEDGRPGAYSTAPYPADCHYAAINSRDHALLRDAGLAPEGCHRLPNMISPLQPAPTAAPSQGQVLCPVRAIRRKNIGEALLLSLFLPPAQNLAITLPPSSPADMPSYAMWRDLAADLLPTVAFEVGVGQSFDALVHAAPFLITTSITEGFGFSFLEPWTAGRTIWGRRLKEICADFDAQGIDLTHLYTRLRVPLTWIDGADFAARWMQAYTQSHIQFGLPLPKGSAERALGTIIREGTVDFGLLHEDHQATAIRHFATRPQACATLLRRQPALARLGRLEDAGRRIEQNRRAILSHFGAEGYRQRLEAIYHAVEQPVRQQLNKERLCRAFLKAADFSLLKWSPYAG